MASTKGSKVVIEPKSFVELDDLNAYNYSKTKENVDILYAKYRNYKEKKDIIFRRTNSSLSFDNLGIYGSSPGDPVGNRVEQTERFSKFIETVDSVYELYSFQLSKDEKILYKKMLQSRHTDDDLMSILNIASKNGLYIRKQSCYIKIARWFDLEVYNEK